MGGLRTAGDLVARAQLEKKLNIHDAKNYVAEKLGIDLETMTDECRMKELREKLDIGSGASPLGSAKGLAAKTRIAEICDFRINSVTRFFKKTKRDEASPTLDLSNAARRSIKPQR
jgi:dimethylamine--corrinoid protein Co-methyltransferase